MRARPPSHAIVFVIACGSAVIACGSEDVFVPELASNERLIAHEAVARLATDDQGLEQLAMVGDLDGDGIDDAVVRSFYEIQAPNGAADFGAFVYVLYGGRTATGNLDISTLPSLTGIGAWGGGISPLGDVNGDGLADFLVGIARTPGCGDPAAVPAVGDRIYSGAYLVYGSTTRLTGARPIGDAGVFLRDPTPCTSASAVAGLGDFDGDGKADFAIGKVSVPPSTDPAEIFVFYGRGERLTGTLDLTATADAMLSAPAAQPDVQPAIARVGDVDGDGYGDFLVRERTGVDTADVRLLRGGAVRLSGSVALDDIASSHFVDNEQCLTQRTVGAALGDLDGDGFDDFSVISCPGVATAVFDALTVHRVFYGRSIGFPAQVGPGEADATVTMTAAGAGQIAGADVDGDGIRDLLVSETGLHDHDGGVHVITGTGARLSGAVDLGIASTTYVGGPERGTRCEYFPLNNCIAHAEVGAYLGAGDLTGDHRADILVSAPTDGIVTPDLGVHGSSLAHVYLVSPPADAKP